MDHVTVGDLTIAYRRRGRGPGPAARARRRLRQPGVAGRARVVLGRVHGRGVGCARLRRVLGRRLMRSGWPSSPTASPGSSTRSGLERPHVLGHSFGADARARAVPPPSIPGHEASCSSARYAGWAGSLLGRGGAAPARLRARRPPTRSSTGGWDPTSMPGLFSDGDAGRPSRGARARSCPRSGRRATRTMAYALAEADLRGALARHRRPHPPRVRRRRRALPGWRWAAISTASIPGSTLTVLPRAGPRVLRRVPGRVRRRGPPVPAQPLRRDRADRAVGRLQVETATTPSTPIRVGRPGALPMGCRAGTEGRPSAAPDLRLELDHPEAAALRREPDVAGPLVVADVAPRLVEEPAVRGRQRTSPG